MAETYLGITHPFPPVWDGACRALVLGTFPSVKSRENLFYYGHPQNRFWRVLAALFDAPVPVHIEEKHSLLLQNHVALWDVLASCDISGSADGSIRNPVPNDIANLLKIAPIERVFANGQTRRRAVPAVGREGSEHAHHGAPLHQPPPTRPGRRKDWHRAGSRCGTVCIAQAGSAKVAALLPRRLPFGWDSSPEHMRAPLR